MTPDSAAQAPRTLPFSRWWPMAFGALAGVLLRLAFFGGPGQPYAPMMGSFIYFAPVAVGAVTVYMAERTARRSWSYYVGASFLANVFFVLGTLLIMIEGLICAIVIVPLFAALGTIGGLVMGVVCRVTNWPRPAVYSLWALPLLLGAAESLLPMPEPVRERSVEATMLIRAPAARVWAEIHDARDIAPDEVDDAWFFRIGVPLPHAGVSGADGRSRHITMGKSVHFEQVVTEWHAQRHVRWQHRYAEDSFPPHALDEHVVLGGHYFDIAATSYTLTPRGNATELRVRMDYRVSTPFNWYADPMSRLLIGNFERVLLEFYRRRSELTRPSR